MTQSPEGLRLQGGERVVVRSAGALLGGTSTSGSRATWPWMEGHNHEHWTAELLQPTEPTLSVRVTLSPSLAHRLPSVRQTLQLQS